MKRIAARTSGCREAASACLTSAWCIFSTGRWRAIRRVATNRPVQMREALDDYLGTRNRGAVSRSEAEHDRLPAAADAPQERFPGSVGVGRGDQPDHGARRIRVFPSLEHHPQGFLADQQDSADGQLGVLPAGGGGNISTVSRAVVVLGLDAVRSIAITVLLFEHLQNKDNANQLKEEFLRANLAGFWPGTSAGKSTSRGDIEQAFHLLDVPQPGSFAEPVLLSRRKRRDQAPAAAEKLLRRGWRRCRCWGSRSKTSASALPRAWGFRG
jgi:hypothetical protein